MSEFNALPGIDDYIDPENPTESKSGVVARYRINQLLDAVSEDIKATELQKTQRRKGR